MFTIISDSAQILPCRIDMPTVKDPVGEGAIALRRKWTRALRRWEVTLPDRQYQIDAILGLLEHVQGDTRFWFDGAGTLEVFEPIIFGIGDGSKAQWDLPHRNIFVASAVIYENGTPTAAWSPLGDGIVMDKLAFTAAPSANTQLTAKYRRKAKVILETEELTLESAFTDSDDNEKNFYNLKYFLQEVP